MTRLTESRLLTECSRTLFFAFVNNLSRHWRKVDFTWIECKLSLWTKQAEQPDSKEYRVVFLNVWSWPTAQFSSGPRS